MFFSLSHVPFFHFLKPKLQNTENKISFTSFSMIFLIKQNKSALKALAITSPEIFLNNNKRQRNQIMALFCDAWSLNYTETYQTTS